MAYSVEALMRQMPKVGDRLERKPLQMRGDGKFAPSSPRPCTVVYVNVPHLWYMVQFESGRRECYKVPEILFGAYGGVL